jgi:hypothetical protein
MNVFFCPAILLAHCCAILVFRSILGATLLLLSSTSLLFAFAMLTV